MPLFIDPKSKNPVESVREYIWHCPSLSCKTKGTILFKTERPYLGEGTIKCPKCGQEHCFCDIMKANKKNIEKFLANFEY